MIYNFATPPTFVVHSQYDEIALHCTPVNCSHEGSVPIHKEIFYRLIDPVLSSSSRNGYFLSSCLVNCQTLTTYVWSQITINDASIADTVGDWYFERSNNTRLKDCDTINCNPTCPFDPPMSSPTSFVSESGAISHRASPYMFSLILIILGLWN